MAAPTQKKQLSLDANLPLDLAEEADFAHEFREVFQQKGYTLFLPPTAVHELHTIHTEGKTQRDRDLARIALLSLRRWRIQPFDLDAASEAIAQQFARRLLHLWLIPDDELNDGLILAETSLLEIPLLVTSDKHLLDIDEDALALAFSEADLAPVHPVHPKRLLRALH